MTHHIKLTATYAQHIEGAPVEALAVTDTVVAVRNMMMDAVRWHLLAQLGAGMVVRGYITVKREGNRHAVGLNGKHFALVEVDVAHPGMLN